MWRLLVVLVVLVVSSICQAQVVDSWVDLGRGSKPAYTVGIILPEIKIWDFSEPCNPCREIGQLWPVKINRSNSFLAGGYLSNWSKTDDWFLEPYFILDQKIDEKWGFNGQLGIYAPLTGGNWAVFSSESRLVTKISQQTEFGLAVSFWRQEGENCSFNWGMIVRQKINKITLSTRWLPFGGRDSARLEIIAPVNF